MSRDRVAAVSVGEGMTLTVADAAARVVVRLQDGRSARLIAVPATSQRRSKGAKARVLLPTGAYLSVPVEGLEAE